MRATRRAFRRVLELVLGLGFGLAAGAAVAETAAVTASRDAWRAAAPPPGTVAIHRDAWGVPHVHASTEVDGFFGLGYAVAEDNLEDTLRQFVIGRGRMAEHFGRAYLEADRQYALFGVDAAARRGLAALPADLRRNLDAYVAGFQRYLDEHPDERPAWAAQFTPRAVDLIGFSQLFTLLFPVNALQGIGDCRRGGVELPSTLELLVGLLRTGGPADASTAWAVAPARTRDGVAIHLADPHNALDLPSPEFRLHAGELEIAGFQLGLLFVGHTRHLAWGTTFGSPDVADCYALETLPDAPDRYRDDGALRRIVRRTVEIPVRGATPHRVEIEQTTLNGLPAPIVARRGTTAYAVVTPYVERAEGTLVDLHALARAQNLDEARRALAAQGLFPVGLTVADASGNIGHFRVGRTPVRDAALDWTRPIPARGAATAWRGLHPFDALVSVVNPPAGYVRETNLPPGSMWRGENPFRGPAYPGYILGEVPEIDAMASPRTRGQRADEVLSRSFALTDEDAVRIAFDERWPNVPAWQAALLAAIPADGLAPPERTVLHRVLRFDGVAGAASREALAYHYWKDGLAATLAARRASPAVLAARIERGEALAPSDAEVLRDGLRRAAAEFDRLGQWQATLGDVFRIGRGATTYPLGGCSTPFEATLHTFDCEPPGAATRRAVAGQKQVLLTVFAQPLRSYSGAAFGQQWRGRPDDPHFNDQSVLTSEHRLKPTLFEYAELKAAPHRTQLLSRTRRASRAP